MRIVKLFERQSDHFGYINFKLEIAPKLPFERLETISKRKIRSFFDVKYNKEFLRYRFELLKCWIRKNETYTIIYVGGLTKLINRLFLIHELNAYEQEYVKHYQGIVFAQTRNIKSLIVDFPLSAGEQAYYKYDNCSLYQIIDKKTKLIQSNGEICITNKKILLGKGMDIYPIEFSSIVDYKISKYGLLIVTKKNTYAFKMYDDYIAYVSFERVLKLMKMVI